MDDLFLFVLFPTGVKTQFAISDISSCHQWELDNLEEEWHQGIQGWDTGKEGQ